MRLLFQSNGKEPSVLKMGGQVCVLAMLMFGVGALTTSAQKSSSGDRPKAAPSVISAIRGVVLDPSKAPVPKAKVILYQAKGGNRRFTTTDAEGKFRFDNIPPDRYEIQVERAGFKVSKTAIRVERRPIPPLRIVLQIAELRQVVNVGKRQIGQVSSDVGENLDAITLDRKSLDALPIMGNDVVGAVRRLLGPQATGPGGVTLVVNGIVTSDLGVPASDIKEVKVNQDIYSAEFSAPGQSRIEIITKTGSQHYHGEVYTEFRNHILDARNAFAVVRPPDQHYDVDGYFSGPLGKNGKTTFSFSGERLDDDRFSVVDALTPTGAVHENFAAPERSTYLSGRINRKIGRDNIFSVRYSFFDWSDRGEGVGDFTLPEAGANSVSRRHYLFVTDQATLSANLVNEFSARVETSDSRTQSTLPGAPAIEVLQAFTGGGAQQDQHKRRDQLQFTDNLSWSHGKHLIKTGIELPALNRVSLDDQSNFGGTFTFSTLGDFQAGKPFSFVQQLGNPRLVYWHDELGAYIQDEVRVRPNLSVALGLRYEWQNHVSDVKNFAPRVAFAFAPGKNGRTVFRGGGGIFFQTTGPGPIADVLRFNGQRLQQIVLSDPTYPNPFEGGGTAQTLPSSVVRFAPDLSLPYIAQYSFGVEEQLHKSTAVSVGYVGQRGVHLFLSRDINAPLPPDYVQRPNPAISMLRQIESDGDLQSDSLNVSIRSTIGSFFSGGAQYTWMQSYDNTGGINWFPANQYDLSGEWGPSDVARHSASFYGTFNGGKFIDLGVVLSARSGLPYTVTTGTDPYGTTFANARPAGVSRNSLEGPGEVTLDVRLAKKFFFHRLNSGKIDTDGPSLKITLDAFNALNHTNLHQPVGNLSSPFFGHPTSAGAARRLQISAGFEF